MKRHGELPECVPSKLKQLAVANLPKLEDHHTRTLLQRYYDRWSDLSERERADVFRIEGQQERLKAVER
jgi:hypothetical protein